MFFNEWNILVVDDEPDVLAVTRLALRDVKVYGLPVKIDTASSKAEASELLIVPLALQCLRKRKLLRRWPKSLLEDLSKRL